MPMWDDPATDAVAMSNINKDSLGEDKYREEALLIQISVGANCLAGEYSFSKGVERGGKGRESLSWLVVAHGERGGGGTLNMQAVRAQTVVS